MCTEIWNQIQSLALWEGTSVSDRHNQLPSQQPARPRFQEACQKSWEQEGWGSHIHTHWQTDQPLRHRQSEIPVCWVTCLAPAEKPPENRNLDEKAIPKQQILQICTIVNAKTRFKIWTKSLDPAHNMLSYDVCKSLPVPAPDFEIQTHWERCCQNQNLCLKLNQIHSLAAAATGL